MNPVIMYVVPLCPYCRSAKRFLSERGVAFEIRNILTNRNYRQEFDQLTDVKRVPVTVIGDHVLVGFDRTEYEQAISDRKAAL